MQPAASGAAAPIRRGSPRSSRSAKHTVVVVTDLAWPHVAGVRFWAARGATIMSHATSRPFLQQLLDRKWELAPDALEKARASKRGAPAYHLVTHADGFALAGGKIRVKAIDGIGSEGALYAWLPAQRFLWASDYLQSADAAIAVRDRGPRRPAPRWHRP